MSWNGSGVFTRLKNWVADKTANIPITASRMDTDSDDFTAGINNTLAKDGQNTPTANLPMANFKHTGVLVTSGTNSRTEYAAMGAVQDAAAIFAAVSGTDTYTANLSPAITAYATGAEYALQFANANLTTTPNLQLNGIAGPVTMVRPDGSALIAGDINGAHILRFDGTNMRVLNPKKVKAADIIAGTLTGTFAVASGAINEAFATIASATTTNIGAALANYLQVTGTTAITAFDTVQAGTCRVLEFAGALLLTNNASIVMPGALSRTTAAGDIAKFVSEGGGVWRCAFYTPASGFGLVKFPPLQGYLSGMTLSNDVGTPSTVLDISAGQATDSTNAIVITLGAFTKTITNPWVAGSGNAGATVAIGINTWVHVFAAIVNGTPDAFFDTSVTAAHAPTGTTAFRRLGSFLTDGSTHILPFTQRGDNFAWNTVPALDINTSLSTTPSDFTLPNAPLGIVTEVVLNAEADAATNNAGIYIYSKTTADQAANLGGTPLMSIGTQPVATGTTSTEVIGQVRVFTDAAQRIRAVAVTGTNTVRAVVISWNDQRGRFA